MQSSLPFHYLENLIFLFLGFPSSLMFDSYLLVAFVRFLSQLNTGIFRQRTTIGTQHLVRFYIATNSAMLAVIASHQHIFAWSKIHAIDVFLYIDNEQSDQPIHENVFISIIIIYIWNIFPYCRSLDPEKENSRAAITYTFGKPFLVKHIWPLLEFMNPVPQR